MTKNTKTKIYFDWLPALAAPVYDVDENYHYYNPEKRWIKTKKAGQIWLPFGYL